MKLASLIPKHGDEFQKEPAHGLAANEATSVHLNLQPQLGQLRLERTTPSRAGAKQYQSWWP
eukprot:3158829-Prorocentrum_lima.AAC.1